MEKKNSGVIIIGSEEYISATLAQIQARRKCRHIAYSTSIFSQLDLFSNIIPIITNEIQNCISHIITHNIQHKCIIASSNINEKHTEKLKALNYAILKEDISKSINTNIKNHQYRRYNMSKKLNPYYQIQIAKHHKNSSYTIYKHVKFITEIERFIIE